MSIWDPTKKQAWVQSSAASGDNFDDEFDKVYGNLAALAAGVAKSADYVILDTDPYGLFRVTNGITKETAIVYAAATNPVEVTNIGHGFSTGDAIVVSNSSDIKEVGNLHYIITKVTNDIFSIDGVDNSGGGAGTLDYRADIVITLPTASDNTDRPIMVAKVDSDEGAVNVTDGSNEYPIMGENDFRMFKSDGTDWILIDPARRRVLDPVTGIYQVDAEFVLHPTDRIDMSLEMDALTPTVWEDIPLQMLPPETILINANIQLGIFDAGASFDKSATVDFSAGDDTKAQQMLITALPANTAGTEHYLISRSSMWIWTKNQTNILRAKVSTDTTIQNLFITGFKTGK